MKKLPFIAIFLFLSLVMAKQASAQLQELEELALDIQKLSQFKSILNDMYKGYKILADGYNTIKDISQGNFSLHKLFLDGLLTVSPTVKKYQRIIDIINTQKSIITQYQSALSHFKSLNILSADELSYIESVYSNLFDGSVKNLDALLMVITDNQLRMSDAERLTAIDRINADMSDKLTFLQDFNNNAGMMATQRQKDMDESSFYKKIFGIQN